MTVTATTDITEFITEYQNRTMLPIVRHGVVLTKLADKEKMPKGHGTTIDFRQRLPLTKVTGSLATSTQATQSTPKVLYGKKITANLYELQNSVNPTRLAKLTDWNEMRDLRDIVALNQIESIEYHNILQVAPNLMHFRADWPVSGGADTIYSTRFAATSAGSTTTTISTALNQTSDNHWGGDAGSVGYMVSITRTSKNFGEVVSTTDFVESTDTITHSAFSEATASGDEFIICIGTGLTTADVLDYVSMGKSTAIMRDILGINKTFMFKNPRGFGWKTIVSEYDLYDLKADTKEVNWQQYNDKSDGFQDWRAGQIYSHDVLEHTVIYRESVAGAQSDTGAVWNNLVIGRHCIAATELIPPHITVVDKADSGNPHGKLMWISWDTTYAIKVVNGCAGAVIMTVPTSLV